MKRTKLSRLMSVVLAGTMVMGCISLSTYAEEVIGDVEEISVSVEEIAENETEVIEDNFFADEEEIIVADEEEILGDASDDADVQEPTDEMIGEDGEQLLDLSGMLDGANMEAYLADGINLQAAMATITLNYETYTLNTAGETVLLTANVATMNPVAAEVEETEDTTEAENGDEEAMIMPEAEVTAEYNVSWISSDESVATVDEMGMVAAVSSGQAIITCTLDENPNVMATCLVVVNTDCTLQEHVHSREECFVRELICNHTSEDEHTADCYLNKFVCGLEEHVHDENCFENTMFDEATEQEMFDGVSVIE